MPCSKALSNWSALESTIEPPIHFRVVSPPEREVGAVVALPTQRLRTRAADRGQRPARRVSLGREGGRSSRPRGIEISRPAAASRPEGEDSTMSKDQVAPETNGVTVELLATVDLGVDDA